MLKFHQSIRQFLIVPAVLLIVAGAGCGSGGDSTTVADVGGISVETGTLSKEEFVKRAGEACEKTKSSLLKEIETLAKANAGQNLEIDQKTVELIVTTTLVPSYEGLIDEIQALGAPSGDEQDVAAFLGGMQQDLDKANKYPLASFRAGEGTPFIKAKARAKAYGLSSCLESFG